MITSILWYTKKDGRNTFLSIWQMSKEYLFIKSGKAKTGFFPPNQVLSPATLPPMVYVCRATQLPAHVPGKIFCSKQQMVVPFMTKLPFYFNAPKKLLSHNSISSSKEEPKLQPQIKLNIKIYSFILDILALRVNLKLINKWKKKSNLKLF